MYSFSRFTETHLSPRIKAIRLEHSLYRRNTSTMVHSSPRKRSALGSISSILNTASKTPSKQGRVGKSASPSKSGIRQKLATLFTGNRENSPRKLFFGDRGCRETTKVH